MSSPSASANDSRLRDWWWIFDPRLSLRARATLGVAVAALLFTVGSTWLGGRLLQRSVEENAARHFESLATQVSDKIDRALYERYRDLQLVANLDAMRAASVGRGESSPLLQTLLVTEPDIAWVGLIALDGRPIAATQPNLAEANYAERSWFQTARERPFAGGLRELPGLARTLAGTDNDSTTFFEFAVPVLGPNGNVGAVLLAHLRWDWTRDVQLSVVPEPALREQFSVTIYADATEAVLDTGTTGWTEPPPAPALPEARRFRGSLLERTPEGAWFFTGFARSRGHRDYRGLGWLTVVRQPLERVTAPVRQLQRTLLLTGILGAAALAAAAWILTGRLTRRFNAMATAADRIREGDVLAVLPRAHSSDEYGRMCGALGELVDRLRVEAPPTTPATPTRVPRGKEPPPW